MIIWEILNPDSYCNSNMKSKNICIKNGRSDTNEGTLYIQLEESSSNSFKWKSIKNLPH